jgi:hypothetical protein
MQRILKAGLRPNGIDLARPRGLIVEGTGLAKDPGFHVLVISAQGLELPFRADELCYSPEVALLQHQPGARCITASSAALAVEDLAEELYSNCRLRKSAVFGRQRQSDVEGHPLPLVDLGKLLLSLIDRPMWSLTEKLTV